MNAHKLVPYVSDSKLWELEYGKRENKRGSYHIIPKTTRKESLGQQIKAVLPTEAQVERARSQIKQRKRELSEKRGSVKPSKR